MRQWPSLRSERPSVVAKSSATSRFQISGDCKNPSSSTSYCFPLTSNTGTSLLRKSNLVPLPVDETWLDVAHRVDDQLYEPAVADTVALPDVVIDEQIADLSFAIAAWGADVFLCCGIETVAEG